MARTSKKKTQKEDKVLSAAPIIENPQPLEVETEKDMVVEQDSTEILAKKDVFEEEVKDVNIKDEKTIEKESVDNIAALNSIDDIKEVQATKTFAFVKPKTSSKEINKTFKINRKPAKLDFGFFWNGQTID